jgi:predicted dehydrogenase
MSKKVKLGAVGTGGIWATHARNLALLNENGNENQVVAVCEVNDERRAQAASTLGARGYATIDEMLQGEAELDGLIACTPPTVRRQIVEAAAPRKLPVFLEKPPAANIEDAAEIVRIVRDADLPVVVGFMYRYLPAVSRLKELIGEQPISLVQSSFFCPAATVWKLPGWFYIKERSGGHVLDQAVHVMDLVRYIAGDITQVHTFGNNVICPKNDEFTIEDASSTNLRFASGASGTHVHSWSHREFTGFMTVIGKEFRLTLHLDSQLSGFVGEEKIDESFPAPPEGASHHYDEMGAFLEAIRSGEFQALRSPFPDAAKSLATVLAMNKSIESGRVEDVQLDF